MFLSQTYHIFVTKFECKNTQKKFSGNDLSRKRIRLGHFITQMDYNVYETSHLICRDLSCF